MDKLEHLRKILMDHYHDNSLVDALFIVVDCMIDAGEDNVCESMDNIGISVNNQSICLVDIEKGEDIAVFTLNLN